VRLEIELAALMKKTRRNQLVLDHDDDVPQQAVVDVLDAARGAGVEKISLVVPEGK
jgi:biopolymer transport protein ExbD